MFAQKMQSKPVGTRPVFYLRRLLQATQSLIKSFITFREPIPECFSELEIIHRLAAPLDPPLICLPFFVPFINACAYRPPRSKCLLCCSVPGSGGGGGGGSTAVLANGVPNPDPATCEWGCNPSWSDSMSQASLQLSDSVTLTLGQATIYTADTGLPHTHF